jgi:hypothetical protein
LQDFYVPQPTLIPFGGRRADNLSSVLGVLPFNARILNKWR